MSKILVLVEGATERGAVSALAKRLKAKVRAAPMNGNNPQKLRGVYQNNELR